jgi:prepilin-type N-terminal cleavage/methylation domain-containing protein
LNKKGFSLIEVIVALGIFAVVFTGAVSLIGKIVSLEYSARDRTTGIALAQGKMEEVVADFQNRCPDGSILTAPLTDFPGNPRFQYTVSNNINPNYIAFAGGPAISGANGYNEVTVAVSWRNRLGVQGFSLKRIISICQ